MYRTHGLFTHLRFINVLTPVKIALRTKFLMLFLFFEFEKEAKVLEMIFEQTILGLALAAVSVLAFYGAKAIDNIAKKAKLEAKVIEDEQQRGLLLDAITDLEFLAEKTVTNIEQTTAKALREAVKDGLKNRSELEQLAKVAFNEVAEALKPQSRVLIEKHFGSFSKYLSKTIEAMVFKVKSKS